MAWTRGRAGHGHAEWEAQENFSHCEASFRRGEDISQSCVSDSRSPAATKNGHEVIKSLNYVADASGLASSRRAYSNLTDKVSTMHGQTTKS